MQVLTPTIVLVHGAFHGAWCWSKVQSALDGSGLATVAIDLPGHGDSPETLSDLHGDAEALRAALDGHPPASVVLVGHSYGGAVITEAGDHPAVRHLVYVAGFLLDEGESCFDAGRPPGIDEVGDLGSIMRRHDGGTWTVDVTGAPAVFYNDCEDGDIGHALLRLDSQRTAALAGVPSTFAWRQVPSTYVVCTADRAVAPAVQRRMAARATEVVEWDSGHSPFLSMPDRMVELLRRLAGP